VSRSLNSSKHNYRVLLLSALVVTLSLFVACGRQTGVPTETSDASNDSQKLPFEHEASSAGVSPTHSLLPTVTRLPAGTPLTIRLASTVSSSSSHANDAFDGTLDEPIVIDGQTIAARGAAVSGRVLAAKASGHLHDPGYIRIALVSLNVGGNATPIETSSIFAKGGSHKKRNLAMIGGGTAAGALIGGLAGGGKGALIGSLIGGGGGTGAAYATGKKEVSFSTEERLTFRLAEAVELH